MGSHSHDGAGGKDESWILKKSVTILFHSIINLSNAMAKKILHQTIDTGFFLCCTYRKY